MTEQLSAVAIIALCLALCAVGLWPEDSEW